MRLAKQPVRFLSHLSGIEPEGPGVRIHPHDGGALWKTVQASDHTEGVVTWVR